MIKQESTVAQGQQTAQSDEGSTLQSFKNMIHEKRKGEEEDICSLNLKLNGSVTILLALGIATQLWLGYAVSLPAISK